MRFHKWHFEVSKEYLKKSLYLKIALNKMKLLN